ncbi:hypothetical protein V6N12_049150 [Hibiscus sabdariffa]|uniref:Uncharacterized protein n=1 Tax=Hibiscus sabdariffa TaxID=183260 RepID=A0ABR2EL20_9ROSI
MIIRVPSQFDIPHSLKVRVKGRDFLIKIKAGELLSDSNDTEPELSCENENFANVWSELGIEGDSAVKLSTEGEDSIPMSLLPPADRIQQGVGTYYLGPDPPNQSKLFPHSGYSSQRESNVGLQAIDPPQAHVHDDLENVIFQDSLEMEHMVIPSHSLLGPSASTKFSGDLFDAGYRNLVRRQVREALESNSKLPFFADSMSSEDSVHLSYIEEALTV